MKIQRWYIYIIVILLTTSASTYFLQLTLFHDAKNTFFYMLQDFAFVPIQVLMVTFILDGLMKKREKNSILNKLNMVIGIFFHEAGNQILKNLKEITTESDNLCDTFIIDKDWESKDFKRKIKDFKIYNEDIELNDKSLQKIKNLVVSKKSILLNLLNNPNLLEHDKFTDLLWAIYHLSDELLHRDSFNNIPESDLQHLKGDLIRVYNLIIKEWLSYMNHLQSEFPYLYSIALRTNPFNDNAQITIAE